MNPEVVTDLDDGPVLTNLEPVLLDLVQKLLQEAIVVLFRRCIDETGTKGSLFGSILICTCGIISSSLLLFSAGCLISDYFT